MGGFKLTNVGPGVNPTDGANMDNLAGITPPGAVSLYAGTSAPSGFLLCDGAFYSRTTYPALFAAIGTTWGATGGASTFNVPDLRGRAPIGAGTGSGLTNRALAATGGEETHVLTTPEIPAHTHTDTGHTHIATDAGHTHQIGTFQGSVAVGTQVNPQNAAGAPGSVTSGSGAASITVANGAANLSNTGGGGSHNNMQPWVALNYIIKA